MAFLAGTALAWGLSASTNFVWAKTNISRSFTLQQSWQALKMAVGWTPRLSETPCWNIQNAQLRTDIEVHASDMICSITLALFVEPCTLQGRIFERR